MQIRPTGSLKRYRINNSTGAFSVSEKFHSCEYCKIILFPSYEAWMILPCWSPRKERIRIYICFRYYHTILCCENTHWMNTASAERSMIHSKEYDGHDSSQLMCSESPIGISRTNIRNAWHNRIGLERAISVSVMIDHSPRFWFFMPLYGRRVACFMVWAISC